MHAYLFSCDCQGGEREGGERKGGVDERGRGWGGRVEDGEGGLEGG